MEINVGVFLLTCIWWLGTPRCVLLIGATSEHVLRHIPGINAGFVASWNRGGRGSRSTGEGYVPPRDLSGATDVVSLILNRIESLSNTNRNNFTRSNLTEFNYQVSKDSFSIFNSQAGRVVDTANAISSLFLYSSDSRRIYDNSIYFALAKGVIESDPMIYGCGFAFVPKRSNPQGNIYCPYVYRKSKSNIIVNTDLSSFNYMNEPWFKNHKAKSLPPVNNAPGISFSRNSDKNKTPRNSTIKMTIDDGFWSQPYFECRDSKASHWIITYSVPFYEQRGSSFKFR